MFQPRLVSSLWDIRKKIALIVHPEDSKNKRQISAAFVPVRSNPDFSGKK